MVVVSMLPHAEIGRNDHREGAPYFTNVVALKTDLDWKLNSLDKPHLLSQDLWFRVLLIIKMSECDFLSSKSTLSTPMTYQGSTDQIDSNVKC